MKTIYFISGLPRSGSTLLVNLLAQNPRFQVAGTSGLADILLGIRAGWDQLDEFRAMPPEESEAAKLRVLRGVMANYHPKAFVPVDGGQQARIIFDKSRTWLAHLEMVEAILGCKAKVIVPVRDVREILASEERLWRANSPLRQTPDEAQDYFSFQCAPDRCEYWMGKKGRVGIAYRRVRDAIGRGLGDRLYFVKYEHLTFDPDAVLSGIYAFLGEQPFGHNWGDVEQVTREDDLAYGMPGLHTIRPKVEPAVSRWRDVLGDAAAPYGGLNQGLGYSGD